MFRIPHRNLLACAALILAPVLSNAAAPPAARLARETPPPPAPEVSREFRGAWLVTVNNIDWPSRPGLPVAQQQAELRKVFEVAQQLRLNAVLFQVRPCADAFYPSEIEPWSEYLSGRMGVRPNPAWDPLETAIQEAHARGIELHAWFNPYRARFRTGFGPAARNHVTARAPQLVRQAGPHFWMDPGESDVREQTIRVILDVVRRYDIDGVHLDDYFYPYPEGMIPGYFADDRSWGRYVRAGGRLNRADWRRNNVDVLVEHLGGAIHREKAWVKFGISPFGIWRPGFPPSVRGLNAFEVLHADSRRWYQEGWVDYLSPQLYWPIRSREQSFPELLRWWAQQNTAKRELWPGLDATRIGQDRNAGEILSQVRLVRGEKQSRGVVLYNFSALASNKGGVAGMLTQQVFTNVALPPPTPWLGTNAPNAPKLSFELNTAGTRLKLNWEAPENEPPRWYVFRSRFDGRWQTEILAATRTERTYDRNRRELLPDEVQVTPYSRSGIEGGTSVWRRTASTENSPQP